METWCKSEKYLKISAAYYEKEVAKGNAMLTEVLAEAEGSEKAFWYIMRAGASTAWPGTVGEHSWADLAAARRLAPDDPRIGRAILAQTMAFVLHTEELHRLEPCMATLRRDVANAPLDVPLLQYNWGKIQLRRGRWHQAYRNLTRALDGMTRWSPERMINNRGRVIEAHARRARAGIACGRVEEAQSDIASAIDALKAWPSMTIAQLGLSLAQAELALHHGQTAEARAALQVGLIQDRAGQWYRTPENFQVEADLVAARIARAEGNREAFARFGEQALAAALSKKLPMTVVRVRAVLAGAER